MIPSHAVTCSVPSSRTRKPMMPFFVDAGGKMDDITVIVAQVKTVVIPDDEVDL